MIQTFPKTVLWITAVIYAGFAIWLGAFPSSLLEAFGIQESTPEMLTEIRAFYGGIELGIAITMLVLWHQDHVPGALLVGGVPLACSATGRAIGMMADGFSTVHTIFAMVEAFGFACCVAGYRIANRKSESDKESDNHAPT